MKRAEVQVERERLETVVEPELQARERHGRVAQDFELQKLQIEAERLVRIASAEAAASLFIKLEAKLFGTPGDVTKLLRSLVSGQSAAQLANGFLEAAGDQTRGTLNRFASGIGQLASAASARLVDTPASQERTPVAPPEATPRASVETAPRKPELSRRSAGERRSRLARLGLGALLIQVRDRGRSPSHWLQSCAYRPDAASRPRA